MSADRAVSILTGHGNKTDGWDVGCTSPKGWQEAELVRDVAAVAWRELQRRRVPAEIIAAGSYHERGQDADAGTGSRLVVQLHADASAAEIGPDRSSVFYWPAEPGKVAPGLAPAQAIAAALAKVVPWPVHVYEATPAWEGPRACLAAVSAVSVLVELGFSDGRLGRDWLPLHTDALGIALGRAV